MDFAKRPKLWELFSFLNEPFRRTARFHQRNLYRRRFCAPAGRGCNPKTHQEKHRRHRLRTKRQRSSSTLCSALIQSPRQLLRPLASRSSVSKTQEIGTWNFRSLNKTLAAQPFAEPPASSNALAPATSRIRRAGTRLIEECLTRTDELLRLLLVNRQSAELRSLQHRFDLRGQCITLSGP